MTYRDYKTRLEALLFTCGMNQRYHQHLQHQWACWDRGIRIAVGIIAVIALIVAIPHAASESVGLAVATIALALAFILNVLPVGEWDKLHAELFHLWSDLRKDAVLEDHKACNFDFDDKMRDHLTDRLAELTTKSECLSATEPKANKELLWRCMEDENESHWGKGIRTPEQVEAERQRRQNPATNPASVVSAVG
jgi:hypothetical protein